MSDLVGNPEDRFSRVAAHLLLSQSPSATLEVLSLPLTAHFYAVILFFILKSDW